jgi:hypothetical protein
LTTGHSISGRVSTRRVTHQTFSAPGNMNLHAYHPQTPWRLRVFAPLRSLFRVFFVPFVVNQFLMSHS